MAVVLCIPSNKSAFKLDTKVVLDTVNGDVPVATVEVNVVPVYAFDEFKAFAVVAVVDVAAFPVMLIPQVPLAPVPVSVGEYEL